MFLKITSQFLYKCEVQDRGVLCCLFSSNSKHPQFTHFKTSLCFSHPLIIQTGVEAPGEAGWWGQQQGVCPCLGCCVLAAGSAETGRPGALRVSGNEQPSAARLDGAFVGTHKHTNKAGTHTNTHICLHDNARILSFALFGSHLLSHRHF